MRFSDTERAMVEAKAAAAGVKVSEWVRAAALGREAKAPVVVPEINREAWLELAGLAANFNRAMALINEGRELRISGQFAENLRDHLAEMRRDLLGRGGRK